jgi:hypothetical protein
LASVALALGFPKQLVNVLPKFKKILSELDQLLQDLLSSSGSYVGIPFLLVAQ